MSTQDESELLTVCESLEITADDEPEILSINQEMLDLLSLFTKAAAKKNSCRYFKVYRGDTLIGFSYGMFETGISFRLFVNSSLRRRTLTHHLALFLKHFSTTTIALFTNEIIGLNRIEPFIAFNGVSAEQIKKAVIQHIRKKYRRMIVLVYSSSIEHTLTSLGFVPYTMTQQCALHLNQFKDFQEFRSRHRNTFRNLKRSQLDVQFEFVLGTPDKDTRHQMKVCHQRHSQTTPSPTPLPWPHILEEGLYNVDRWPSSTVTILAYDHNRILRGFLTSIRSGSFISGITGAMDADNSIRADLYTALLVQLIEYSFENGLQAIEFGACNNKTKLRLANVFEDIKINLYISSLLTRLLFRASWPMSSAKEIEHYAKSIDAELRNNKKITYHTRHAGILVPP